MLGLSIEISDSVLIMSMNENPQSTKTRNIAFIDGQNLYTNTAKRKENPWTIDLTRFRVYLEKKYNVGKAYYVLGIEYDANRCLYERIRNSGFILLFRLHNSDMVGKKKGNVDSDIIFYAMEKMYRKEVFDKIILVSGDGDYKLLVDFLIEEGRFAKILFPDKKYASSLYQELGSEFFDYLENKNVRDKIELQMKRAP